MRMTLRHTQTDQDRPAPSVEELQALIDRLTTERQRLRATRADAEALEQNRREIAATQWQLSYALIARYLPQAA